MLNQYLGPSLSNLFDPLAQDAYKARFGGNGQLSGDRINEARKGAKYPNFIGETHPKDEGTFDKQVNPGHEKNDKGHLGDPEFKNLFKGNKVTLTDLSPEFGTEIEGVQLSELDDQGKNDLALYLETRGLAVFRNQDFKDKGPAFATEFGRYFGPLHVHPVSFVPEGHPELLVQFRPAGDGSRHAREFANQTSSHGWHSDISFEEYPASFSFFTALEAPESGGDTVFIDLREAYRRLSPVYQKFLETLTVIHTNFYQNQAAKLQGQIARVKADYFTEHPLIRTHPVTGEKSIFFSRGFIHSIKGLKPSESAAILGFLEDHITNNPELQVRASYKGTDSNTVVAWDNRFLLHTAIADFLGHETPIRHHFRITVLGEKPYLDISDEVDVSKVSLNEETA